jgi:hypothetical protein
VAAPPGSKFAGRNSGRGDSRGQSPRRSDLGLGERGRPPGEPVGVHSPQPVHPATGWKLEDAEVRCAPEIRESDSCQILPARTSSSRVQTGPYVLRVNICDGFLGRPQPQDTRLSSWRAFQSLVPGGIRFRFSRLFRNLSLRKILPRSHPFDGPAN